MRDIGKITAMVLNGIYDDAAEAAMAWNLSATEAASLRAAVLQAWDAVGR